MKVAAVSQ
jgi:hypothetical protein